MYDEILDYGKGILINRYSDVPYNLLTKLINEMELLKLRKELACNGFKPGFIIETNSLDQTVELMRNAKTDVDFVLHTINYIALRNPLVTNDLIDFLQRC